VKKKMEVYRGNKLQWRAKTFNYPSWGERESGMPKSGTRGNGQLNSPPAVD
jgi:hypothetical protein